MKLVYFSDSRPVNSIPDLNALLKADALVVCPGYGATAKCCEEVRIARERGIPIFEELVELSYWLRFSVAPSVDKVA